MAMFKRILALLLAAAMLVAELPTAALAQAVEETAAVEEVLAETSAPVGESTEESFAEETSAPQTTTSVQTEPVVTEGETEAPETTVQTEASELETTAAAEETTVPVTEETIVTVLEATEPEALAEAEDDLSCFFDEDGCVLTISGSGEMVSCAGWDEYRDLVETVVIEEGVTSICGSAFADMSSLTLVLLPNSLTDIGDSAFRNCTAMSDIIIPAGVTRIGQGAFEGCTSLSCVDIFGYDVTIGENAFSGVSAMVCYPYDSNWSDYGSYGGSLSWSGYMPVTATGLYGTSRWLIYQNGFLNLVGTGTLEEQSSASGYPWHGYAGSATGVSILKVENVPQYAFSGFTALTSIQIGRVSTVGSGAFSGCSAVSNLSFTSFFDIASDAFTGVTASVNYRESDGWTEDKRLGYGGDLSWSAVYTGNYGAISWELVGSQLSVYGNYDNPQPMESQTSVEGYPWYAHRDRITMVSVSGTSVGDYAFDGYSGLTMVQFNNVTEIGTYAFRGCGDLAELYFYSNAPTIAEDAFTGVTANAKYESYYNWTEEDFQDYGGSLTWSQNVYVEPELASGTHGENASWTLSQYGTLTVTGEGEMENMTSAEGYGWYEYRDQIRQVTISGLTSVGDYAFAGYSVLTRLELGESITKVGSHILDGSGSVQNVVFECVPPASIAEDAFAGLANAGILYPYRYQTQWEELVDNAYGGTDLWWSVNLKSIASGPVGPVGSNGPAGYWNILENGEMVFNSPQGEPFAIPDMEEGGTPWNAYLDQITSISMNDVASIGANAFAGCTALTYVDIPETVTAIGANAFAGCTALETVCMNPEDSVTIAENAFQGVTATVYYYTAWDSALLQNYGGSLTWEQDSKWLDGGSLDGIGWDLWSSGGLSLYAQDVCAMPSLSSAADYPWSGYADRITDISVNNITSIGDYAFAGCAGVSNFTFTYLITALGNNIFEGCTNLKELTFHGSAPEFSENTFYGVTATVVFYPTGDESWTADKLQNYGGTITWGSEEGGEDVGGEVEPAVPGGSCGENLTWTLMNGTLTISGTGEMAEFDWAPDENGVYACATPWQEYEAGITAVVIGSGVTSISSSAFENCANLEDVSISDTVEAIEGSAFGSSVVSFTVSEENAYYSSVDGVLFEQEQMVLICYPGNKADVAYRIPDGVTCVQGMAINGAVNLMELLIPASVTSMGVMTAQNLTTIHVETDNTNYCAVNGVLFDKEQTTLLHYPAGKEGREYAIPETVTRIDMHALMSRYLEKITIPASVTAIGEAAFAGRDTILSEIVFQGDAPTFEGMFAFNGVTATVYYPADNATWTEDVMQQYGGTITWEAVETTIGGSCGENLTWTLVDGTLTISGTGAMTDYAYNTQVPWFDYRNEILSVEIQPGVTGIGAFAFVTCANMVQITIPDSVVSIGKHAFAGCESLANVVIPERVTSIGEYAFNACGSLTRVTIPTGVTRIETGVFSSCWSLTEVKIPDSVTEIGSQAFMDCESLTGVTIPAGVVFIEGSAFSGCVSLSEVTISEGVVYIEENAFSGCRSLTEVVFPITILAVGEGAFAGCSALETVIFPESVTSIREESCVIKIGNGAFAECSALEKLTIPVTIDKIGENAFADCAGLKEIRFLGYVYAGIGENALLNVEATAYYPANDENWTEDIMQQYGGTITWTAYDTCGEDLIWTLENGILTISGTGEMDSFAQLSDDGYSNYGLTPWEDYKQEITAVVIESGVTSVGDFAFDGCGNLQSVSLPGTMKVIGNCAFSNCPALTEAVIPDGVVTIGISAFYQDTGLMTVTIPDSVVSIGGNAFGGCSSLTAVTIPGSVANIGDQAFNDCIGLTELVLSYGIVSIGEDAFAGCTSLTAVMIPESVTEIGVNAFLSCWALKEVVIPSSVTTINKQVFADCGALAKVTIGDGVTAIGESAFDFGESLTSIVIPASVESIGEYAFGDCTGLTEIRFEGNAPAIAETALLNVTATAYYPVNNDTWTDEVKRNYGGTITWVAVDKVVSSGSCGVDLTWELTESGTLTISGTGEMQGYDTDMLQPEWYWDAVNVKRIVIEEGVTSVGSCAFYGDFGNVTEISLPDSLVRIGAHAFEDCKNVTELDFGSKLESIDSYAFISVDLTGTLTLPDSLKSIGASAFRGCTGLTAVELGNGVEFIGDLAFGGCSGLESITMTGDAPTISDSALQWVTTTVYYPAGNATWTDEVQQNYGGTITWVPVGDISGTCGEDLTWVLNEKGVLTVSGTGAMDTYSLDTAPWAEYRERITQLVLEEGITSIGEAAFYGCTGLTSVECPDSLLTIEKYAFQDCDGLESVSFNEGLEKVRGYSFDGCDNLSAVKFPDSLIYIGGCAFMNCTGLSGDLVIPGNASVAARAFNGCTGFNGTLTVLPGGEKYIDQAAFRGCTGFTGLELGSGITEFGDEVFYNCTGLTGTVVIPATVTTMGTNVFGMCSGITHLRFESVDCPAVENNILGTMSALESIYVPGENYASYEDLLSRFSDEVEIQTDWEYFPVEYLTVENVYSRTAVLSWDCHRSGEEAGYIILRDGVEVGRTTDWRYADRTLEPETAYRYAVQAYFEDGRVTPVSDAVTAETVLPEITGLSGYVEYAGIKKFADVWNTVEVVVPDKGNLAPLGDQTHSLGLYYSNGGEETLIGWANTAAPRSVGYSIDWNVSLLSDGEYTLRAVLTDVDGTTAEWTETVTVDNTPPAKLLQLTVTGAELNIELGWTEAREYDTVGYHIYRGVSGQNDFRLLAEIDGRGTLSYTDTTAGETEMYEYYVVGVDIFGREARAYDIVAGSRIPDTEKPRVLQLLPVSGSVLTGAVTFSVKAEDNVAATRTKVEYSADQEATWTELTAVDGKYTLDTAALDDGRIQVRAYAYDAANNESDAFKQSYLIDNTGPGRITWQESVTTSVTLTLRWADVEEQDIGGFRVEQKQQDGTWKTIAQKVTALGHNLRGLTPGTDYTFRVTAYDIYGNFGEPSEEYTVTTAADTTAPVTAQLLPKSNVFAQSISLSATVEDDYCVASAALEYSLDGILWTQLCAETYTDVLTVRKISGELDLTEIPEGLLYVRATAVDQAGNTAAESAFVQHMVDRTAPDAPANVTATGHGGYVEVCWDATPGAAAYKVWRADSADGEFVLLSGNHTYLNYVDRNVEDGASYSYRVAAVDAAGNLGESCEAVSAQATPDTQAPEILSVSPTSGSVLSSTFAQVSALARDNSALYAIVLEYSHDGEGYVTLTEVKDINSYGTTAAGTVPVAEFAHGDTVWLRISAMDCAGNACDPQVYTYTIDTQAPAVSQVTAQYNDGTVLLSWTGGGEADLAGYRIYRRDDAGVNNLIGQVAAAENRTAYTWTDGSLPVSGGTFTYQIEAVDQVGNTATGSSSETVPGQNTPVVEVPERTGPTALLDCDAVMTVGFEYIIDGSGSTDDGQIVSYDYDFGDGTTGTGKSLIHTYAQEGTYKVRLTVTDNDGQTATFTRKVTVKAPELVGTVTVRIVDEKGAPVPNAPVYFDLGDEEKQVIRATNSYGYVTFTAEAGRHTVGCVILNNEWLPVKRDLIVKAGETTSVSMTLINKPIVEGTFEIKPMTLEEIEAAGIDLTDPENQYYVEVELHLQYDNVEYEATIPGSALGGGGGSRIIFDPTGNYKPKKKDDDEPDPIIIRGEDDEDDDDDDEVRSWSVELIDKSEDPKLMILDIPIGIQSLKEMFDVRLHILNNASSDFSMLDNVVTLDLPGGLSVVTDAYMKSQQTAHVAEIKGGTQETIEWVVRGDQPGEYWIGADYSGILSQFNESLTARFEAQDPIEVYGLSGLSLIIEVAEELEKGTLYYNLILENNGKVDIYKPNMKVEDILIEAQLYDATGHLSAEGTEENSSGINMEAIKDLIGDTGKDDSLTSISKMPDILKVGNKLIMYYMSIDRTEYTHCVMELTEMSADFANTYGLEDVQVIKKPLDYFRQSMNTQVNSQEKAEETFTTNKDAYNQIITNKNYVYWAMANDKMEDYKLSDNADEVMWDLLKGDFVKAATDNEDTEQVKAMVIDLLAMSAESVDDIKYDKQLKFLKKLRGILDGPSVKEILGDYADSFEKALDSAYEELKERGVLYETGSSYALEDLIYQHWKKYMMEDTNLSVLDMQASFVKLQKILADKESEDVWKAVGLSIKALQKVRELTVNVMLDLEWILEAQAKEDAMLVCLNAMINNFTLTVHLRYEDSMDVLQCLEDMKLLLESEGIAYVIISNLVDMIIDYGIEKLVGKGTDVVMEMVGGGGDPLTWFVIKTVNLTAAGIDMLTNLSGQQDMADQIRFAAMLSDTARSATINARNVYKNNKTPENAARYMQLLKLLINLRALGESQVALYGKSFETDFTVGNLPLLKAVRAKTDAEKATSWYQWRDIVEDRISELKVRLLRNPLSTEITGRERPTVSFDYVNGQTLQSFDETFEYSLDKGETWTPCDGGPIPVEAPDISTELWVRKIDTSNTDMTETGSVMIHGPLSVDAAEIEVLKTPEGYRIEGLNPEKNYQVTFSAEAMDYGYDTELELDLPEGSYSYSYATDATYRYVYIRAAADTNGYASDIAALDIVSTVNLNVFVTGDGLVSEYDRVWEYGSQVSVTATPAANRAFDGWYRNGVRLSGEQTYTFTIYSTMYLEARFRELEALPGVSAPINAENGSATVTTGSGTGVSVTGAPETADTLVVETVTDAQTQAWITECLAGTGLPAQILDIYAVDAYRNRVALDGAAVKLEREEIAGGMLLCGIAADGTVTILDSSFQDGAIGFTCGGSVYYVLTSLLPDRYISVNAPAEPLLPGEKAQLSAEFLPGNPTGTKLQWSLAEGDDSYASLKVSGDTAVLTALSATGSRDVTVTVSAADGSFPSTAVRVEVLPYVYKLTLHTEEADVTGGKIRFDINGDTQLLELRAEVAPADAIQDVIWSISGDADVAEVTEGLVTFLGKTGTVKITAAAADGSEKTATVTIQAVALTQNVAMAAGSVCELVCGKSATFEAVDADTGVVLTKSQLTWSLAEEYAPYASITTDGKLTTKAVAEETPIVITGRVVGNEETGVVEHTVIIRPKATYVEVYHEDALVNGETLLVDTADAEETDLPGIQLDALLYPGDAMEGVTWKTKDTDIASVDPETGLVTVKWDAKKNACKSGTVTVTATAADGSKVSGSVKVKFGVFVKEILIEAPDGELRSGQKMTLTAETDPVNPTKGGVTWSLVGEDDSSFATISTSGKLTAKTVYDDHTVTVRATAKDGSGTFAEYPVNIRPKSDGILTIYNGEKNVTKATVSVDLDGTREVVLDAYTLDEYLRENVTWKSSSKTVASLEDNGDGTVTVTMLKSGATTITATAEDGRTAKVTLKAVRLTKEITVATKTGEMTVASGKSLSLTAAVLPKNATTRTVRWSVAAEDAEYASISSSGKLTAAKGLLEARTISVTAAAKDGGASQTVQVLLTPAATGVSIHLDTAAVTNTTQVHNMVDSETLQLEAKVYPLNQANGGVTWKSSNKKIASVDADGVVTCKRAGTVTITATAKDGSKQKASFKLKVEKWMSELTLPDIAVIAGGKTLTMTKLEDYYVDPAATNKTLIWSMEGEGAAFATLSSKGVLKTKKVTEAKTLTVTATAADGGGIEASCEVTIYPATTRVRVLLDDEAVTKKLTLAVGESLDLDGTSLPVSAAQAYTWKSSSSKYAKVDEDGVVTAVKAGKTISITCMAADGSGKSAVVKIQIVKPE